MISITSTRKLHSSIDLWTIKGEPKASHWSSQFNLQTKRWRKLSAIFVIMNARTFAFAFLALTATVCACSSNLPISPSLVGRNFTAMGPCEPSPRLGIRALVRVNETSIFYKPFSLHFREQGACEVKYIIKFEKWAPLIIKYPSVRPPEGTYLPFNIPLDFCEKEQPRQQIQSRPQGPTRNDFIDFLNRTINGIEYLRDHECRPTMSSRAVYEEEYLHPWLDGIITYLRSVAYNFDICLDWFK